MIETDPFCSERLRPTHERKIRRNCAEILAGGHPEFFAFFLLRMRHTAYSDRFLRAHAPLVERLARRIAAVYRRAPHGFGSLLFDRPNCSVRYHVLVMLGGSGAET
jgi:hypothetical protein